MFRCPITGEVSAPGEKPCTVVLEKRQRAYWNTPDGKEPAPGDNPVDRDGEPVYRVVGHGSEVVREALVSHKGLQLVEAAP
jgi:hypothetical protein